MFGKQDRTRKQDTRNRISELGLKGVLNQNRFFPVLVQTRPGLFWSDQDSLKHHTIFLVQTRIILFWSWYTRIRPYIFFSTDRTRTRTGFYLIWYEPEQVGSNLHTRNRFKPGILVLVLVFWYFFRNTSDNKALMETTLSTRKEEEDLRCLTCWKTSFGGVEVVSILSRGLGMTNPEGSPLNIIRVQLYLNRLSFSIKLVLTLDICHKGF